MRNNVMSEHMGEMVGYAKMYAGQQYQLMKLELAERLAKITAGILTIFLTFVLGLFILLIASIGFAIYLGELWDSFPLGFLALAGIYFCMGLAVIIFRRYLVVNPLLTMIIKQMTDEDEEED